MDTKNITFFIVAILLAGVGSFYGGMKYQQSKSPFANFQRNGSGIRQFNQAAGQNGTARRGGNMIAGEIIKTDEKSLTLKLNDGGSKIVYLDDAVSISKSADGSKEDLAAGKNVMVSGSANQDGSIMAQFVQIRPDIPVEGQANPDPGQSK